MNDFTKTEPWSWYTKAEEIINSFKEDKVSSAMRLAAILRETYLKGKDDGVKEWNGSER